MTMGESVYDQVQTLAKTLGVDFPSGELAVLAERKGMGQAELAAVLEVFDYLSERKREAVVATLLKTSRLPLKNPKTFETFDFDRVKGRDADAIRNLPSLSNIHARKNIAFIGPQGVGKTHLAMAYGRACCQQGMKTYFLKASELNQKFTDARNMGREGKVVASLAKPSCLIIDEVGRCRFGMENTRLFFDLVDRRYEKEGPNLLVLTSNYGADKWGEYFGETPTLLCALDRIFDNATVFMMKGESYRGQELETFAIETLPSPGAGNKQ